MVDSFSPPQLQRLHDFNLMDVIQESGQFTLSEIRRLNYCRLYLKAMTASDIAQPNGRFLDKCKLQGESSLFSSKTHGQFIHQERPSEMEWKLWRKANSLWSTPTGEFRQPLGEWVLDIRKQRQHHHAYWADSAAWILIDGLYTKCAAVGIRVVRETIVKVTWEDLPDNAIVTQVNGRNDPGFWWVSYDGAFQYDVPSVPPATFSQYVARLPEWEEALLHHTDLLFDPFTVATMLSSGVRSVSDGSEWDQTQGSFGWSLSDKNGIRCATGMGPAHGSSPTSYRSESYGMLSILCFLRRLAEFTGHVAPWEGIVATDSDSLLKTLRKKTVAVTTPTEDTQSQHSIGAFPLDPLLPEWDVVRGIQVMAQSMPGLELRYVAGHQDKKKAIGQLSLLARLNVEADAIANKYQRDYGHHQPIVPLTAWAGVHLILPAGTITSHYETALRYQATSAPLQHHMMKRYSWTLEVFDYINWKAHGKSLKRHLSKRTHLIKFVHGILPTNATLHRKDPLRNRCPACGNCVETWSHIPRCKINAREEWRKALLAAMNNTCNKWSTDPQLRLILCKAISGWLAHSETSPEAFVLCPSPYPPEYGRLIRQQKCNRMGPDSPWTIQPGMG
ncbi:hypothetical protein MHU86_10612 [Fragilaria crotonensis]|nr:hypothetical protein MHU86_10612 [Fragilaria crotonensis]